MKLNLIRAAAVFILSLGLAGVAFGKLPEPTEEQKAAAAEKKTKDDAAAEKAKAVLAKAQDRVAKRYIEEQKAKGITVTPTPIAAAPPAAPPAAPAAGAAVPNPAVQQPLAPQGGTRQSAEAHSAPAEPKGDKSKNPVAKPN